MLAESRVFATIAVIDIAASKTFYGETLGLQQVDENPGGVTYESGGGKLFVYESQTAGTSQATCASWDVADIEAVVAELQGKGVQFETYPNFPVEWQGVIAVMGPMKSAWFKDPSGNILAVGSA